MVPEFNNNEKKIGACGAHYSKQNLKCFWEHFSGAICAYSIFS